MRELSAANLAMRRALMIALTATCLVTFAPLHAAEIRGDMSRGVVLEGQIEAGDYDKLKSTYGDMRISQFYVGSAGANELYLASPGGNLAEAIKIGRLVRALKLNTIAPSRYDQASTVARLHLKNPKANYMCASACFFIFVAGINRTQDITDAILGIHRPYLSDSELKTMTGDQAISSANQVRTMIENYLKEMNVPAKYADLMFSIPPDQVRWINDADFHADLEGVIPELKDWLAARCDKRTDVEKAIWKKMMADSRLIGELSTAERSIFDIMEKQMQVVHSCEYETLNELSADAWLQMFDPTCTAITPEARSAIIEWRAKPLIAQWRTSAACGEPK